MREKKNSFQQIIHTNETLNQIYIAVCNNIEIGNFPIWQMFKVNFFCFVFLRVQLTPSSAMIIIIIVIDGKTFNRFSFFFSVRKHFCCFFFLVFVIEFIIIDDRPRNVEKKLLIRNELKYISDLNVNIKKNNERNSIL